MRRILLTVAAALFAAPVIYADDKSDADARAALALARAKANSPAIAAATRAIPYADAIKVATREGKPIFVAVGQAECRGICGELRPDMVTCHEARFAGSDKPRWILAVPSKGTPGGFIHLEWTTKPAAKDIKAEAAKYKALKGKTGDVRALEDAGALLAMITLGVMPADEEAVEYVDVVCENGVCRVVPAGYQRMPQTPEQYAAMSAASDDGGFVPRFPRVAKLRARARAAVGLSAPQVRGTFVQSTSTAATAAKPLASATGPKLVGGPLRDIAGFRGWLRTASPDDVRLIRKYIDTRVGQGGTVVQAIEELITFFIAHGPELIAVIEAFLKAFSDLPTPFLPYAAACEPAWSMAA